MLEVVAALCWNRRFLGAIRPKEECIKSCETCFAKNALNLNDKGPSIKWVCFPKFYGPLAIWPWLRISLHSSLNVIYCLIITDWPWLMSFTCVPVQIEPSKAHWGTGSWPFSSERSATFPPQADHVFVDLFSSTMGSVALLDIAPPYGTKAMVWDLSCLMPLTCHQGL